MTIETRKFGRLEVDEKRIITFPVGLLGFPSHQRFVLLLTEGSSPLFQWLQSVDDKELFFLVTSPSQFCPGYEAPLSAERRKILQLEGDYYFLQTLVICNRAEGWLTGNLLGPIVINTQTLCAAQVVFSDSLFTTRERLMPLPLELSGASQAVKLN